jgi:peptide deformylase
MSEHSHDHDHDEHDHDHDHDGHDHEGHDHDGHSHHDEERRAEAEADARRRLALAQIRQYPDSALRLTAHDVVDFDDDLRRLADRMTALMHEARGVGLAATQVGVLRRMFVFEPDHEEDPIAIVNPVIVERGDENESDAEGCLSLQGVSVPVERATRLVLEGKDPNGNDLRLELEGYGARVAQHEYDHLDGVLIIDRTDDEHRREALAVLRPRVVLR